jgi:peptide/nickel transport system substrate-binding protein
LKRIISIAAVFSLAAISLTACSAADSVVPNSHLTIAEVGSISTLNPDVVSAGANKIASDVAALTTQNFFEVDKSGQLVANTTFGSVKVTKQSPFTVTYTLGKSAVWSDGSKLDATDLVLAVAASKDEYFNSTHFGSSLSTSKIVGSPNAGDSSLTLQFDQPIADWKTVLDVAVPAHIVGKVAGIGGNVAAVRAGVMSAVSEMKQEVLADLAKAYTSAFSATASVDNFLTNGAYSIKSISADKLVLKAERDFSGLHSGIAETVNILVSPDNATAFKQVGAGKVDLFSPQVTLNEPQADLVSQSQSLSTKTVTVVAPGSNLVDQFVVNLSAGSLADSTYRDPKTAETLRQAFMNIVPKARAIDFASMIQTVSKADSFVYSSSSKNYSAVAGSNGSTNFVLQDTEKASELIAGLKLGFKPNIRVLFDSDNPASVAEWTLLSDHAATSGFRLTNVSSSDPSDKLATGLYDVYLGTQALLGVGTGSIQVLANGPAKMPMETYNELAKDVFAANDKNLGVALQALDKKLFELGYGLPMYQVPTLLVYNNRVQGLMADPFGSNSTWGYWTWHVSADK